MKYCIRGYFRGGFIFASQTLRKFPLQFMSIHCNENIRKIAKLSPHEFPQLGQNHEIMAYTVTCLVLYCLLTIDILQNI